MTTSKVATMRDAIDDLVRDGDTVAIEGFTHLISFAAGHEIIRQRKRDLTLARLTPDLIYDQMIAGGVASKLIFSWLGNPGVGGLGAIRRRIEGGEEDARIAELQAAKEAKYREIRDTELDHAAGKLSEEDFRRQDAELRAEAIEFLKQLDKAKARAGIEGDGGRAA